MISHNMDEIADYCNRIAVLGGGRLAGIFTPGELFDSGELIESLGLRLPTIAYIAKLLRSRGLYICATNEDELVKEILALKEKKNA